MKSTVCEHCGTQTSGNDSACPQCGRFPAPSAKAKVNPLCYTLIGLLLLIALFSLEGGEPQKSSAGRASAVSSPCEKITSFEDWINASAVFRESYPQCLPVLSDDYFYTMPVEALYDFFEQAEEPVRKKFTGKVFTVYGTVSLIITVSVDGADKSEIIFKIPGKNGAVYCLMDKEHVAGVDGLQAGDKAAVKGTVDMLTRKNDLLLKQCSVGKLPPGEEHTGQGEASSSL